MQLIVSKALLQNDLLYVEWDVEIYLLTWKTDQVCNNVQKLLLLPLILLLFWTSALVPLQELEQVNVTNEKLPNSYLQ